MAAVTSALALEGVTLSTSQVAEWKLWADTVAQAIHDFEVVEDVFETDVVNYVNTKQPASLYWYAQQALNWQYGDTVLVNETGQLYYAITDTTKQIIKQCSVTEVNDAGVTTLLIKVAAQDTSGNFIPLTNEQKLEFTAYMEQVKWAGTYVVIVSQIGDVILYDIDVDYSGLYSAVTINAALVAAANVFKSNLSFNALFYQINFLTALKAVPGIEGIKVNTLTGTPHSGSPVAVGMRYELAAGYFNWDVSSTFNLTAV